MVVYMYLAILIVTSIITGIIVTIIERKGFYPKPIKVEKKKKTDKKKGYQQEPVIMNAVTIMNMQPVTIDEEVESVEDYNVPVMVSSYTVDLSDVVKNINEESGIDRVQEKNKTEGLV